MDCAIDVDSGSVAFVVDTSPRSRRGGRSPSTRVEGVCGSAVSPRIIFRGVGGPLIAFHSAYPSTAGSDYDTSHLISFPATSPRRQHAGRASIAPLSFRARPPRVLRWPESDKHMVGWGCPRASRGASPRVVGGTRPQWSALTLSARGGSRNCAGRAGCRADADTSNFSQKSLF